MRLYSCRALIFSTLFLLILSISGCDDSDDFQPGSDPFVSDISLSNRNLLVGESTLIRVTLSYDLAVNLGISEAPYDVELLVQLPDGLSYRQGTAEIQDLGDSDTKVTPDILECPEQGVRYLRFTLDGDAIDESNTYGTPAITLTADATTSTTPVPLLAVADKFSIRYSCTGNNVSWDREEFFEVR